MALTRLDLDELLRFESQRAQDLATLLSGGDKLADQERQKCMLRERWRRQHEDLTLEKCSPEAMGRLDASVLQSLKQHVKASTGTRIEEGFVPLASSSSSAAAAAVAVRRSSVAAISPGLDDLTCLRCWPHLSAQGDSEEEGLLVLVRTAREFMDKVLQGNRDPGPKPGVAWEQRWRHRAERLKRQYSAQVLQGNIRGFLARIKLHKIAAVTCIARWWLRRARQNARVHDLKVLMRVRTLQRYWRKVLLRKRTRSDVKVSVTPDSESAVIHMQRLVRGWRARRVLYQRQRWERRQLAEARLSRAWRSTRHRLADRANAGVLADLAASELSLAKDSLEMEALKIAERDACAQQVRAYEKRIGHHLRRAKLPPGWVLSEEETDDSASSGDARVEDGRANRNRYLNLKSGQLVDKHPNLTKLDELKMKARRGADRALQMRLEELDALKAAIRMQHVALVEQTMRL